MSLMLKLFLPARNEFQWRVNIYILYFIFTHIFYFIISQILCNFLDYILMV